MGTVRPVSTDPSPSGKSGESASPPGAVEMAITAKRYGHASA